MKTIRKFMVQYLSLLCIALIGLSLYLQKDKFWLPKLSSDKIVIPCTFDLSGEKGIVVYRISSMKITTYTNREQETDSSPNITATGRMVYEGSAAVSPDLFRKIIHPGDIIYICKLQQYFIVEDTTNARLCKTVDIFMFKERLQASKKFGTIRSDVIVYRLLR